MGEFQKRLAKLTEQANAINKVQEDQALATRTAELAKIATFKKLPMYSEAKHQLKLGELPEALTVLHSVFGIWEETARDSRIPEKSYLPKYQLQPFSCENAEFLSENWFLEVYAETTSIKLAGSVPADLQKLVRYTPGRKFRVGFHIDIHSRVKWVIDGTFTRATTLLDPVGGSPHPHFYNFENLNALLNELGTLVVQKYIPDKYFAF